MSWFDIGAAGISAAGGIFGAIGQNKRNMNLANTQHQHNIALADRQNTYNQQAWERQKEYNIDMWNRQNKYNSPIEQLARMKAAGLNPHLFYGLGSPGNAQQVPTANLQQASDIKGYDRATAQNVMSGIDAFKNMYTFKNMNASTDNTKANTEVLKAQAANVAADTIIKASEGRIKTGTEKFLIGQEKQRLKSMKSSAQLLKDQVKIQPKLWREELKNKKLQNTSERFQNQVRKLKSVWASKGLLPANMTEQMLYKALYENKDNFLSFINSISDGLFTGMDRIQIGKHLR